MLAASPLHQILDLARWAPSGDNTQPWGFELVDESRFVIHGHDTRADTVYDLDGRPSQISLGALIETATIAASAFGLGLEATRRTGLPDTQPTFDVILTPRADVKPSPLLAAIRSRSVQRRPLRMRALTNEERQALTDSVGAGHELAWFASWSDRVRWATLLFSNAGLRLRLPEAFEVHKRVIEWDARFSPDRIPDQALGVGPLTIGMMRSAMTSWRRVDFLNTWLAGTVLPRLQMDLIPALACAAHVAIVARKPLLTIDDYVQGGQAVQRFWLTATRLGLQHQPEMTPLIFARYIRQSRAFTSHQCLTEDARGMAIRLDALLGTICARTVWLGRIGDGEAATARSTRRPLEELLIPPNTRNTAAN